MNKIQEFSLKSILTSENDRNMLHIEVRSIQIKEDCYYKRFQYQQLSEAIRFVFENITQIYLYLQKKDVVYFEQEEGTVNICLEIAGQMKQFEIPLDKKQRSDVFGQKKLAYEEENKKLQDDIYKLQDSKQKQLQNVQNQLITKKQELVIECSKINLLNDNIKTTEEHIIQLRNQSEQKMTLIRKMNPNQQNEDLMKRTKREQIKSCSVKQRDRLEIARRFWIQQTKKIKGERLSTLKNHINDITNFDKQKRLELKSIELKKMQIVEVFNNIQIINLSKNKIKAIQGLSGLKHLLKLNLSENIITCINGLQNNLRLIQLVLNKNQIKVIANLFHLTHLQVLSLNENEIEEVPKQIAQLYKLAELQLIENKIVRISTKIESLKNLKIFFINGNRCYKDHNKSKQIINRLMKNQVKTAFSHSFIRQ